MNKLAKVTALIGTLFLGGCMVGPDFKKPERETPEQFIHEPLTVEPQEE